MVINGTRILGIVLSWVAQAQPIGTADNTQLGAVVRIERGVLLSRGLVEECGVQVGDGDRFNSDRVLHH